MHGWWKSCADGGGLYADVDLGGASESVELPMPPGGAEAYAWLARRMA